MVNKCGHFLVATKLSFENVQHFYQLLQLSRDMMHTVKTTQNPRQHFNGYFHTQVIMGPDWFCLVNPTFPLPERYQDMSVSEPVRPYKDPSGPTMTLHNP